MKNSVNSRKNAAKIEKKQRKLEADIMETLFPQVAGIGISMIYAQQGIQKSFSRVINFFPGSFALFRINCLNKECVDGGYDFTQVLTEMIENRKKVAIGDLSCEGSCPSVKNSTIAYKVSIQYSRDRSL